MPKSAKRCQEIREEMRKKILDESMLYFAKNGFRGTKISDLAGKIGIGQGTIYTYFASKEELFLEINNIVSMSKEIGALKLLVALPLPAASKIKQLSKNILDRLNSEDGFAAKITLNTQLLLEQSAASNVTYDTELYRLTAKLVEQGQDEGSVVAGSSMKLVDLYWGTIYLYSLKKLFTSNYEELTTEDLSRVLIRDTAEPLKHRKKKVSKEENEIEK